MWAPILCSAVFVAGVGGAKLAWSAEFLAPLPIQDLTAGERYTLGIRPSRSVARRTATSKIDLYAEGLSNGASFRMVGDEIWELVWFPSSTDAGVHSVRILVTERGRPTEVLEVQELTFVVDGVPVDGPAKEPSLVSSVNSIASSTEGVMPTAEQVIERVSALAPSNETAQPPQPSTPLVSVNLDSQKVDPILVVPANIGAGSSLSAEDAAAFSKFVDELDESDAGNAKPAWSLASIASRVVTPHQWVRFPVELVSESSEVSDSVAVQVDALPNGATFDENEDGTRQFQWRPGTADGGEHVFKFTAIDTEDSGKRQTVTMRIIVQE